jgi:AraC-like DNA-binding protein
MSTDLPRTVSFYRDASLQDVEVRFSQYRQSAFQKHFHETYSVGVVTQGLTRLAYTGPQERIYTVSRGDIVLINPGEIHACNPQEGSVLTYFMYYIQPALVNQLVEEVTGRSGQEFVFGSAQAGLPIVRDTELHRELAEVGEAIFSGLDPEATSRDKPGPDLLEIETRLYEALSTLILRYGALHGKSIPTGDAQLWVQQGQAYLMEHLREKVSLAELAAASGLSKYHFLRAFRARYGVPPHIYQLQQRINLARELLAAGRPIADVANEVGFADQSHFTRKFKVLVGATPREYQSSAGLK